MPAAGAERLFESLRAGKVPPVVVLLGDDAYWRDLCRQKLVEALVPEAARGWAVSRLSAEEADAAEVAGRAQTPPLLSARQILFIGEAEVWGKGGGEAAKDRLAPLEAYFDNPAPFTVLVLEAAELDQRTRFAKLLAERALVVELGAGAGSPAALAAALASERGVELEDAAAAALVGATGGRAARLATELDKLACYAGESRRISAADVHELVVAEGTGEVWALASLLAAGRRGRALELVGELMGRGETAPKLVGALAWMYRKLVAAAELPAGTNPWQAARALGMRPETAGAAIEHARRLSREQLAGALALLADADNRLKLGSGNDLGIMLFLVASLSGDSPADNEGEGS